MCAVSCRRRRHPSVLAHEALAAGGTVVNQAGATISGYAAIYAYHATATVVNAGQVIGIGTSQATAIVLGPGSAVTNQSGGTIAASYNGIVVVGGTVLNAGSITGSQYGVFLNPGGGHLTNLSGGIISGTHNGAGSDNAAVYFTNAGTIYGANGNGVYVRSGGLVSNLSGGTIDSANGDGVSFAFAGGTLVNAGRVAGSLVAAQFPNGFPNLLVDEPGATFVGAVYGGNPLGGTAVSTLELASSASVGTLAGLGTQFTNFGSIVFDAGASWLLSGNTTGLAGIIRGFAADDTIQLTGVTTTGSSFAGGVLTLHEASGSATLSLTGSFSTSQFVITNVAAGTDISIAAPCFVAGTRIATERGELPVEQLRIGDRMHVLPGGGMQPVVWLGHRTVNCARHPAPRKVWPVCVAAHAFGPGRPSRDLWLSPDHAIYLADVLIPVKHLINGTSIAQVPIDRVTYHHVELPRHAVLLAEGLPAESYLNTGDRANFANGPGPVALHPDLASRAWDAEACAPLVVTGPRLAAVRNRIAALALHPQRTQSPSRA